MKNEINKVVILAGGLGKRFRPYTFILPKPLIPMKTGESLISNIILKLKKFGFENFYISCGYKDHLIKSYLNFRFNKKINFTFLNEKKKLGTAGPLSLINDIKNKNEKILVINGDIITDLDIGAKIKKYKNKNFDILTFVYDQKFNANIYFDITKFIKKKLKALEIFDTVIGKFPFPRSKKNLEALAMHRGSQAGCKYAESFMLLKSIN